MQKTFPFLPNLWSIEHQSWNQWRFWNVSIHIEPRRMRTLLGVAGATSKNTIFVIICAAFAFWLNVIDCQFRQSGFVKAVLANVTMNFS
jgi:hypothetical protein